MRYTYKLAYYWEGEKIPSFTNYDKIIIYSSNDEITDGIVEQKTDLYKYIRYNCSIRYNVNVLLDDTNSIYDTRIRRLKIKVLNKIENFFIENKYISSNLFLYINRMNDILLICKNNKKLDLKINTLVDFKSTVSYIKDTVISLYGNDLEIAIYLLRVVKELNKLITEKEFQLLQEIKSDYAKIAVDIYFQLLNFISDLLFKYLNYSVSCKIKTFQTYIYVLNAIIKNLLSVEQPKYNDEEIISKLTVHIHKNRIREILNEIDVIKEKVNLQEQLKEVSEIISLSYIAKKYFNKTRSWLYQKINENIIHGKRCKFTDEELKTLQFALDEIKEKIGSIKVSC